MAIETQIQTQRGCQLQTSCYVQLWMMKIHCSDIVIYCYSWMLSFLNNFCNTEHRSGCSIILVNAFGRSSLDFNAKSRWLTLTTELSCSHGVFDCVNIHCGHVCQKLGWWQCELVVRLHRVYNCLAVVKYFCKACWSALFFNMWMVRLTAWQDIDRPPLLFWLVCKDLHSSSTLMHTCKNSADNIMWDER